MERRAENFYAILIILIGGAIVLFSGVSFIKAVTGKTKAAEKYQSSASPFLVGIPSIQIIDTETLSQYPTTDEDFIYFHKTAKELIPILETSYVSSTGIKKIEKYTYDKYDAKNIADKINKNASYVNNMSVVSDEVEKIKQESSTKAQSEFTSTYTTSDATIAPTTITYQIFYQKINNKWYVKDVTAQVSSS